MYVYVYICMRMFFSFFRFLLWSKHYISYLDSLEIRPLDLQGQGSRRSVLLQLTLPQPILSPRTLRADVCWPDSSAWTGLCLSGWLFQRLNMLGYGLLWNLVSPSTPEASLRGHPCPLPSLCSKKI